MQREAVSHGTAWMCYMAQSYASCHEAQSRKYFMLKMIKQALHPLLSADLGGEVPEARIDEYE